MVGRRNAHGSQSRCGTWIACACASLCWISPNLAAQTRSVTPAPAVAPAQAPPVCAAPTAADHVTPGRVIASPGDIAGRSANKPGTNAGANAGANAAANARQWTVQVASFESLLDAQSMQQSLCGHGYEARIVGAARPYVVRVGRFPTSQDALVTARRLSAPKLTVFVTQAER